MVWFDEWWEAVIEEADRRGAKHLLGHQDSHSQGFDDGWTLAEEVDEAIYVAASDCDA